MAGTQEILHGSLLKAGSLPKSVVDAQFQAFLDDKLGKTAGGTVAGVVSFDSGNGPIFSIDGGQLSLQGGGAKLELDNGAAIDLKTGTAFTTAVNITSTATPSASDHLATKGYIDTALAAAPVRFAAPRAPTTGAVDGVNKTFVFAGVELAADGEFVEVDGLRVYETLDYTISSAAGDTTVTFVDAPPDGVRVRLGGFKA